MIVSVCSDKGSPGVTTTAVALGMVWPGERVLLEADPSGGDLALRMRSPEGHFLARQPTVRALSVDARSGAIPGSLLGYAHHTSLGVPVIPATDMRTEDFTLIARQWPAVASVADQWTGTVIADVGRLQEGNSAGPLAAASTVVLLIGRATPEGFYHLRERASALAARLGQGMHGRSPLAVAAVCSPREHEARIKDLRAHLAADPSSSAVPVAGWIAEDPAAELALRVGEVTKKLTGSALLRSARDLAETLLAWWSVPAAAVGSNGMPMPPPLAGHRAAAAPGAPQMNTGRWAQ